VFSYPLAIQLTLPRRVGDAVQFTLIGPPGVYTTLSSVDLSVWSELGAATNNFGNAEFTDVASPLPPQKFYRALSAP
jgi:hypothetical protein